MRATWLGQAGFYFRTEAGLSVMIDPYLSNSLERNHGPNFKRQVEIREEYFDVPLDVLILTHLHDDHTDFDTLDRLLDRKEAVIILSPLNIYWELRKRYSPHHIYLQFERGIDVTVGDVLFHAVLAAHTDEKAIGVVMECEGKNFYLTGDTMYHRDIPSWVSEPDYMFFPINGWGNNMNAVDACRLVNAVKPGMAVPIHWDMFAPYGYDPDRFAKLFGERCTAKLLIPKEYEETDL